MSIIVKPKIGADGFIVNRGGNLIFYRDGKEAFIPLEKALKLPWVAKYLPVAPVAVNPVAPVAVNTVAPAAVNPVAPAAVNPVAPVAVNPVAPVAVNPVAPGNPSGSKKKKPGAKRNEAYTWTHQKILLVLTERFANKEKFQGSPAQRRREWILISDKLNEIYNDNATAEKCSEKFRNLLKTYRENRDKMATSGNDNEAINWPYFNIFHNVYKKSAGSRPPTENIASSPLDGEHGAIDDAILDDERLDADQVEGAKKKRKISMLESLIIERNKEKEERKAYREERNSLLKEKNSLLKEYLDMMKQNK